LNEQKKIFHVISSFNRGGAEVLLTDLIQYRHLCNFNLFVLSNNGGPLLQKVEDADFQVAIHPRKGIDLKFIFYVRKYIKENRINIVHIHDIMNGWNILFACLLTNVKIVFTVHGWGRAKKKYLLIKFVDHVGYVSKALKDHINAGNPHKESILYNGIASKKFGNSDHSIRKEINIKEDSLLMGFVGNFNTVRDQLTVCKALKKLKENGIDFTFLFVGAAHIQELYDECITYCKEQGLLENVKFLGSRSDVPEILSSLDLFVYSSNHDTFGIAVVEAMISGTPVVVNDLNVFNEITDGGRYARLYKSKDESDLAEQIEYLIKNPDERKALGLKGKKWAEDNYSIEAHIDQLNDLYVEILKK